MNILVFGTESDTDTFIDLMDTDEHFIFRKNPIPKHPIMTNF